MQNAGRPTARLGPLLARVAEADANYLRACVSALRARRGPPAFGAVTVALDVYDREIAALRQEGATRELPVDAVEHIFTLGFALDQLRAHLKDLARCVSDFAPTYTRSVVAASQHELVGHGEANGALSLHVTMSSLHVKTRANVQSCCALQ